MKSNISTLTQDGSIAVLTIENGAKNLLTEPEFIEEAALLDWLGARPELTGLVITGAGRHFSQGADTTLFSGENISCISEKLVRARHLLRTIESLPLVTAAAVNGGCFGGGLEIALACRYRICSPKALLGLTEIMHGVVPGMGGMERMMHLLGAEKALELILSGAMLSAKDALACGMISRISQEKNALPETLAFVKELTEGKTSLQIRSILETMHAACRGEIDPSSGKFEQVLAARNAGDME